MFKIDECSMAVWGKCWQLLLPMHVPAISWHGPGGAAYGTTRQLWYAQLIILRLPAEAFSSSALFINAQLHCQGASHGAEAMQAAYQAVCASHGSSWQDAGKTLFAAVQQLELAWAALCETSWPAGCSLQGAVAVWYAQCAACTVAVLSALKHLQAGCISTCTWHDRTCLSMQTHTGLSMWHAQQLWAEQAAQAQQAFSGR